MVLAAERHGIKGKKVLDEIAVAENWQGWVGTRHFTSVEEDFVLTAKHNGRSAVEIKVEIKNSQGTTLWAIESKLEIDLGALEAISQEVQKL
jgi:hypothetical protein